MSDDYALVRVKDSVSGSEYTTSAVNAASTDGLTVLDKPAVDDAGYPLAGKPASPKGRKPTTKES